MKKYLFILLLFGALFSCQEDVSKSAINIVESDPGKVAVKPITPIDINQKGFDFLEKMQGHWVGINRVMTDDYPWFAFDYRAISPSHIHGIFEGGTLGNLYTSFFVTTFKGTRTLMVRNGGILNGIYRSSYFVMDSVRQDNNGPFYRFVDAHGGVGVMSIEIKFVADSLFFNAYTSRLGAILPPVRHMTFKGKKHNPAESQQAAQQNNFPQNIVEFDFSTGFKKEDFWVNGGADEAHSATFMAYQKDPFKIIDHNYISSFKVNFTRPGNLTSEKVFLFLSLQPITDETGALISDALNKSVVKFPELEQCENSFTFEYQHPGTHYVTAVIDKNKDGFPSVGDWVNVSKKYTIKPSSYEQIDLGMLSTEITYFK